MTTYKLTKQSARLELVRYDENGIPVSIGAFEVTMDLELDIPAARGAHATEFRLFVEHPVTDKGSEK